MASIERCGPLQGVRADADGRTDPQAAEIILGGVGILDALEDVFVGDQALEMKILVHHQDLLDLVFVEKLLGVLERGSRGGP